MSQVVSEAGFGPDIFADVPLTSLAEYKGGGALVLSGEDNIATLDPHLKALDLIVVTFPSFADGRGFSQARALRAIGYNGHLRARGHVLVDQFRAALRCGFDDIEITDEQAERNPEAQWRAVPMVPSYQSRVIGQNVNP